jgi:hypothetical protein
MVFPGFSQEIRGWFSHIFAVADRTRRFLYQFFLFIDAQKENFGRNLLYGLVFIDNMAVDIARTKCNSLA